MLKSSLSSIRNAAFITTFALIFLLATSFARAQAGFREMVPTGGFMAPPPASVGSTAWSNGITLMNAGLAWLSDVGLTSTINAKLTAFATQIDQHPPFMGGTMVVVIIQQSIAPDEAGNYTRSYLSSFIPVDGGTASTPLEAEKAYNDHPQIEPSVPSGFETRHIYFWYPSPQGARAAAKSKRLKTPSK